MLDVIGFLSSRRFALPIHHVRECHALEHLVFQQNVAVEPFQVAERSLPARAYPAFPVPYASIFFETQLVLPSLASHSLDVAEETLALPSDTQQNAWHTPLAVPAFPSLNQPFADQKSYDDSAFNRVYPGVTAHAGLRFAVVPLHFLQEL